MSISVHPVAIVVLIIIVSNFLMGFGRGNIMKKGYILVSSALSVAGIFGMIAIRPLLISKLNKYLNNGRLDAKFVSWAVSKFDFFALISIVATCLIIIVLLYALFKTRENKDSVVCSSIPWFVNSIRILNFFIMIWYSFGTINKEFDLAAYLSLLSICEIFALYIPLIARRVILLKK